MAVGPDGTAYVAFIDNVGATFDATVMKFNGSDWELVGTKGFTQSRALDLSLVLDAQGTPYVSFRDTFWANKATVMKFNGSSWVTVGQRGFTYGSTNFLSLALDSDGNPYVAFQDNTLGYRVSVMKFNGTAWVVQGKEGFSAGQAFEPKITIGPQNTPYVVFRDASTAGKDGATVMRLNGAKWENVGPPSFSDGYALYPKIAISAEGVPYVAYADDTYSLYGIPATVKKFDGTEWVVVGKRGFTAVSASNPGSAYNLTLALDSHNKPVVGYSEKIFDYKASVMHFNGTQWEAVGNPSFSEDKASSPSLALHPSGVPYLAFADESQIGRVTVMRYGVPATSTNLANLTLSTGTISPAFASATTSYVASVANEVSSVAITPTVIDAKATITVNGAATASGTAYTADLSVGENTITIVVSAEGGTSKTYTLAVTRSALPAPNITVQPTNTSVCPGSGASFSVTANHAVSYQWQVFTTSWQSIAYNSLYSGATTATLTIANSADLHNTQYRCVVTGSGSSQAITQAVSLSAIDVTKPTATAKNITVLLDASGRASITPDQVDNNSTDNCGIQALTLSKTDFDCENIGANDVTLTVTDRNGNTNTATATVTVQKAPQAITFNALAAGVYGDAPITLDATSSSGGAIAYTIEGPAMVSGNLLTITGAGEVKVTASQAGTLCHEAAAPVTQTMQVEKATATITLSNLEQPENGQPRVVTATTTPEGLAVAITYNQRAEAPAQKGTYDVLATVNDANYKGTATATLTIQVPTGLGDDIKELKGVSLYPNPTRDGKLYLELENVVVKSELLIEVFSASGSRVRSMQIRRAAATEVDLSSCAAGLYLVRVTNGNEVKTVKIQKQ